MVGDQNEKETERGSWWMEQLLQAEQNSTCCSEVIRGLEEEKGCTGEWGAASQEHMVDGQVGVPS